MPGPPQLETRPGRPAANTPETVILGRGSTHATTRRHEPEWWLGQRVRARMTTAPEEPLPDPEVVPSGDPEPIHPGEPGAEPQTEPAPLP